jgi:demethylmenaquinone methyltransferase/2-methoxy-6-polyprenyl-1,4-benzoquinol methylase
MSTIPSSTTTAPATVHAPHRPLTDYYANEQERQGFVRAIFDRTAPDYDRVERLLALGSGPWYRHQALQRAGLKPGMRVLDVGIGTGLMAREAVLITGDAALVTGVDPSAGMMASAKLPAAVNLIEGRAEAIPLPDASFDFLSMGYALRHIGDFSAACREFHRVLKPGGRICLLEITRPEGRLGRLLLKAYMKGVVPVLASIVGRRRQTAQLWRYYWDTIESCVPPASILATLETAGFTCVRRHVETRALSVLAEYQAIKPEQVHRS